MKTIVIGGTGHIGSYLVPALMAEGHEVTVVTRGRSQPYRSDPAWRNVRTVTADRESEDEDGTFGERIRDLEPDIVVDLISFSERSTELVVNAVLDRITHFLHCGTIWVHGRPANQPTTESEPRRPFGNYGKQKARIERLLLEAARVNSFPATILHPGHIVGPGWAPINPAGNLDLDVFRRLATGKEVLLPNRGLETLHHVHAVDVADAFVRAIHTRPHCIGQSFHIASESALRMRDYAESIAGWFGRPARLRFVPWRTWREAAGEESAEVTWDHLAHSPYCSIEKAKQLLGYTPRYSSLAAVQESLAWLIQRGELPPRMRSIV